MIATASTANLDRVRKGGALASLLPLPPDPATAGRYGIQAFMVHGHPNIVEIMPEMTRFPEIAKTYAMAEAAAAHEDFERSLPRGRLVLVGLGAGNHLRKRIEV